MEQALANKAHNGMPTKRYTIEDGSGAEADDVPASGTNNIPVSNSNSLSYASKTTDEKKRAAGKRREEEDKKNDEIMKLVAKL